MTEVRGTIVKPDLEKKVTYEDYVAICKALGIEPKPPTEGSAPKSK